MGSLRRRFVAGLGSLLAAACTCTAAEQATAAADHLVILHVNDSHGQFHPHDDGDGHELGGVARLAHLVSQIRAQEGERVLLLHAGDVMSRGLPLTVSSGGEADLQVMDRIGFDALTPGNGDFYFGTPNLIEASCRVRFPVLHANVEYQATGSPLFPPYMVRTMAGIRVGILGLGEVRVDHPSGAGLALRSPIETARELVPELRRQADLVLALTHLGFSQDSLLAASVPGIDIVVGGHSHTQLDSLTLVTGPAGGAAVPIAQARDEFRYLGRIDLYLARKTAGVRISKAEGHLIPVDATVPSDSAIAKLLARLEAPLDEALGACRTAIPLRPGRPNPAGQLVVDAVRAVTGADVALLDAGAVQAGLDSGAVTLREVCLVHPWRNRVVLTRLSAARIVDLARGRRLLVAEGSTGLARLAADSLDHWNAPADSARVLLVAAGEYALSRGGSAADPPVVPSGYRVDTALEKYIRQQAILP